MAQDQLASQRLLAKRKLRQKVFRICGIVAISKAALILALLLSYIIYNSIGAFTASKIALTIPENLVAEGINQQKSGRDIFLASLSGQFPEITVRSERKNLIMMFSQIVGYEIEAGIKDIVPGKIPKELTIWLTAADEVDSWRKMNEEERKNYAALSEFQKKLTVDFEKKGIIESKFNSSFFTSGDSREPELAGMGSSIIGSILLVMVCMAIALPLGVGSAIYLEEFAPKNKLFEWIEININNLAAVPSIIYGLLGLAVYINFFGIPRSSALVGGMTLALMALPTIIISTRAAIAAIPQNIRDAAMGLGASPIQVIFHHVLPLSIPGIMTGAILSIARTIGETAPLIMIGMVAFIADIPSGITDSVSAMPVQIYLWSDSPERAFAEKTSATILTLLTILLAINMIAIYIRAKFEKRW